MVKPEDGVKRGHFERGHVSTSTHAVVDFVVHILETSESPGAGAGIPSVEAEGIEVAV